MISKNESNKEYKDYMRSVLLKSEHSELDEIDDFYFKYTKDNEPWLYSDSIYEEDYIDQFDNFSKYEKDNMRITRDLVLIISKTKKVYRVIALNDEEDDGSYVISKSIRLTDKDIEGIGELSDVRAFKLNKYVGSPEDLEIEIRAITRKIKLSFWDHVDYTYDDLTLDVKELYRLRKIKNNINDIIRDRKNREYEILKVS